MTVSMITAGLLGLLLLFLGGYVVAGRVKFKVNDGDGGNETMRRRIRAQANFVEYVPMALILMLVMETATAGRAVMDRQLACNARIRIRPINPVARPRPASRAGSAITGHRPGNHARQSGTRAR